MRLQLNAEDLANIRVSTAWGSFNEAVVSLPHLRNSRPSVLVEGWRRAASERLGEWVAPLLALTPRTGFLELHTIVGEATSIGHALERLEAAPADHLGLELCNYLPPETETAVAWAHVWMRDLKDGDRQARRRLADLIWKYHQSAIDPFWGVIDARLEAERARCGRIMATGGVGEVLDNLHPRIRWRPPILELNEPDNGTSDGPADILDGRSLILVPSVFCLDRVWLMWHAVDDTLPRLLVYPVLRGLDDAAALWTNGIAPGPAALSRLLGPTRAGALDAIADGCTTTGLARRLGVSPATASHHVGVLREARLIHTSRDGNAVRHRLSELGVALLNGHRHEH